MLKWILIILVLCKSVFSCTRRNPPAFFPKKAFTFLWESPSASSWLHAVLWGLLNKFPHLFRAVQCLELNLQTLVPQNVNLEAPSTGTENHSCWLILMEPGRACPFIHAMQGQIHGLVSCAVTSDLLLEGPCNLFNILWKITLKFQ